MIYMKTPTVSLLSSFDPENQICGSVAQLWWGRTFCGHRVSFCRKLKLSTDRLRISVLNAFSSVSIKGLGFAWANRDYFEEVATGDLHLLHNTSACVEGPYLHGFLTLPHDGEWRLQLCTHVFETDGEREEAEEKQERKLLLISATHTERQKPSRKPPKDFSIQNASQNWVTCHLEYEEDERVNSWYSVLYNKGNEEEGW